MTVVLAWICIALGTLIAALTLIKLTISRATPEMTEPRARSMAWSSLLAGLLIVMTGLTVLAVESKDDAAEWVTRLVTLALLILILASWLRARRQGKSAGGTTEAGSRPDTNS
jgi:hypothetical protein